LRIDGLWYAALAWLAVSGLAAAEHRGRVESNGLPVPGAAATAQHVRTVEIRHIDIFWLVSQTSWRL